jgi:hypothetical protein
VDLANLGVRAGVNARSGWQESHWWGLWGPRRVDGRVGDGLRDGISGYGQRAGMGNRTRSGPGIKMGSLKKVWKAFCKLREGKIECGGS